jgi:hypothetical protein
MQPDPEYLRQHYASLSDEALLELDRADLVEMAQPLYDREMAQRGLASAAEEPQDDGAADSPSTDFEISYERASSEDRPDWLEDASVAISYNVYPGSTGPPPASDAFEALRTAGIPCCLDLIETPPESAPVEPKGQWRVMVPAKFSFRASNILNKQIFNADFEESWKAHLEELSDDDLAEMSPREALCGLFDQIERATRVYNEELARRRGSAENARGFR